MILKYTKQNLNNLTSFLFWTKYSSCAQNTIAKFSKTFLDVLNLYFCLSNFHCKQEYEQNNHQTMPTDIHLSL